MKQYFGCDAHKKYSVFVSMDEKGKTSKPVQIPHDLESYRKFLAQLPEGSDIAVEATGHWYWIVDEMERASHIPHLTDPLEAKKRMGKTHKSDPIDAPGLSLLLRYSCGTLPEVWIPPASLRDQRELLRPVPASNASPVKRNSFGVSTSRKSKTEFPQASYEYDAFRSRNSSALRPTRLLLSRLLTRQLGSLP
jgi:hypothetical protein